MWRLLPMFSVLLVLVAGCAGSSPGSGGGQIRVVAAENFWGSIAAQLGGSRAATQSIITNPAQDPHSYEPSAADARVLATAQLAIVNGVGYDSWATRLLAANPLSGRMVITVGDLFGAKEGSNPHLWYDPSDVDRVVAAITADLKKLDPNDGAYYDRQRVLFESHDLAAYHRWIALISKRYGGTPVGASESIFAEQAPSLGLDLKTPPSFMKAISEGTDVTAQDVLTAQGQIETHAIKVWIYNSQNATPQIQRLNALARRDHVPLATITETLSPASATFEQWQVAQLQRIAGALHAATGR